MPSGVDAYFRRIALAHRELSADNLGGALKLLGECPDDLRKWEWHLSDAALPRGTSRPSE